MKVIKLKNLQDVNDIYCGQSITISGYHIIQPEELDRFASDNKVIQHVASGLLVVNYNDTDLSPTNGEAALLEIWPNIVGVTTDDTQHSWLDDKIVVGDGLEKTVINSGENEQLRITTTTFDLNRMVLDCDGSLIYIGSGDIVTCEEPLPGPVSETNCE